MLGAVSTVRAIAPAAPGRIAMATQRIDLGVADDLGYEIVVDPTAEPMLTDAMIQVVRGALAVVQQLAQRHGVADGEISVWGFTWQEDGNDQLVLTHVVDLPPKEASAYQDDLSVALHAWKRTLPRPIQKLATEMLSVWVEQRVR